MNEKILGKPDCWIVLKIVPKFSNGIMIRGISEILAVFKSEKKAEKFAKIRHEQNPNWGIDVYSWWFDD